VEAPYLSLFDKSNENVKEDYHSKKGTNINQNRNDHLKEVQMKTSMMKLGVFVIIAAIAMFTVVGMASAADQQWKKAINGEYAIAGTGACLFAFTGFNDNFIPNGPSNAPGPNFWDGVVTFKKDGHGSIDARHRYMDIPTDNPTPPAAGSARMYWEFTYTVDRGKITFTEIPATYLLEYLEGPLKDAVFTGFAFSQPYDGYISADGKNLIVSYGVPMKIIPPPGQFPAPDIELICSGTWQGFRTDWED
jgi:hypothetical protein